MSAWFTETIGGWVICRCANGGNQILLFSSRLTNRHCRHVSVGEDKTLYHFFTHRGRNLAPYATFILMKFCQYWNVNQWHENAMLSHWECISACKSLVLQLHINFSIFKLTCSTFRTSPASHRYSQLSFSMKI